MGRSGSCGLHAQEPHHARAVHVVEHDGDVGEELQDALRSEECGMSAFVCERHVIVITYVIELKIESFNVSLSLLFKFQLQ